MSSASDTGEYRGVPPVREVWRAAGKSERITLTVTPDARSTRSGSPVQITGDIAEVSKIGTDYASNVLIRMVPDDEIAPVEIEAEKEGGEWGEFRAFSWEQPPRRVGPQDHVFRYIGAVTDVSIPEGRWNSSGDPDVREVTA